MNKHVISVSLAAILAVSFLTGCVTPSNNQNAQAAITAAAAIGTAYDLEQRPSDLPYFLATEAELYTIASSTNVVSAASISAALEQAGVTNKLAEVGLVTAINIGNSYINANSGTNTLAVQQVCSWVADGISQSAGTVLKANQNKAAARLKAVK